MIAYNVRGFLHTIMLFKMTVVKDFTWVSRNTTVNCIINESSEVKYAQIEIYSLYTSIYLGCFNRGLTLGLVSITKSTFILLKQSYNKIVTNNIPLYFKS